MVDENNVFEFLRHNNFETVDYISHRLHTNISDTQNMLDKLVNSKPKKLTTFKINGHLWYALSRAEENKALRLKRYFHGGQKHKDACHNFYKLLQDFNINRNIWIEHPLKITSKKRIADMYFRKSKNVLVEVGNMSKDKLKLYSMVKDSCLVHVGYDKTITIYGDLPDDILIKLQKCENYKIVAKDVPK